MIYLDNAATSFPKPEAVHRGMDEFVLARSIQAIDRRIGTGGGERRRGAAITI